MKSSKSPAEAGPHTCGYAFSTLAAHQRHNMNGECVDPADLGFVLHKDGRYGPAGSPILGERLPDSYESDPELRPKRMLNVVKEQRPAPPVKGKVSMSVGATVRATPSLDRECRECGKVFQRPTGRGRPPVKCPECRSK